MAGRREAGFLVALVLFAGLYFLVTSEADDSNRPSSNMATSAESEKDAASQRDPSTKDLVVSLADGGTKNPSSVEVTIENTNPEHTLTFLKWDSPLDQSSLNSGVFKLHNVVDGQQIPSPGIKLNRMLPPPREDLVEVQPESSVSAKVELKAPWIPADGREVKVQVEGQWRAVWPRSKAQVQDGELRATSGDDVLKGPFESEKMLQLAL